MERPKNTLKGEVIIEEKTEVEIKEEQNMLEKIYKELVELRTDFNEFKVEVNSRLDRLETDMVEVKQDIKVLKDDVTSIKQCPTIKKELSELDDNNNK